VEEETMGTQSLAPTPTPALPLYQCATVAEEVRCDLDRVAALLDELAHSRSCTSSNEGDPSLELVERLVSGLADKLRKAEDALYGNTRREGEAEILPQLDEELGKKDA
jgi:hypothetical protein